jgi:hypothetical protein
LPFRISWAIRGLRSGVCGGPGRWARTLAELPGASQLLGRQQGRCGPILPGRLDSRGRLSPHGQLLRRVSLSQLDFHQGSLDGFLILDEGDGVKASVRRGGDAAHHALVEVAEPLSAQSGEDATDSGDLDVGADSDIEMNWMRVKN